MVRYVAEDGKFGTSLARICDLIHITQLFTRRKISNAIRARMRSPCNCFSVGVCGLCDRDILFQRAAVLEPKIGVIVSMKGDRRGQCCTSRVGR